MKKRFNHSIYIILPWIITSAFLVHAAQEEWHGSSVTNVIDNNLVITNNVHLPQGGTSIQALHKDIDVRLDKNIVIKGNNTGPSELYLVASAGHSITMHLNNDLLFQGTKSNPNVPLLIVQSGAGEVIWEIEGDKQLSFTSVDGSGGVNYYLLIDAADEYTSTPQALFRRALTSRGNSSNLDINIGKNSVLGYLSNSPVGVDQGQGSFIFDASNTGEGLMSLNIANRGAVIVSPRRVTNTNPDIILSDISKSHLAGGNALFEVINSQGADYASSLFIVNSNKTLSEFLFDPFLKLNTRSESTNYTGSFSGKQYGFIVGSNGVLSIEDDANINYVGLTNNVPTAGTSTCDVLLGSDTFKARNASALIFDQSHNPLANNPQVSFGGPSALFLRSGVDIGGGVRDINNAHPFTIPNSLATTSVGNFVMDVEGDVEMVGEFTGVLRSPIPTGAMLAKIELLSLEVAPTGGSLFPDSTETDFPVRTFAENSAGQLYRYNSGAFLINGHLNLNNVSLVNTNENATVVPNDDVNSVPTYVGGETFNLLNSSNATDLEKILMRPKISFINSRFLLLTSAALTGVDLLVPNAVETGDIGIKNYNEFLFGYNGYAVDNGTSRFLILGTDIGSTASDGVTVISGDAHLDIMQTSDVFDLNVDPLDPQGDQTLALKTIPNTSAIEQQIGNNDITGQFGTQTIYLGNNSNISIGTNNNVTGFFEDTHPWLHVAGDFFAFNSAGGILQSPSTSVRTGTGGIFVDLNGKLSVDPLDDATFNVTIARNYNGIIDIPINSAVFNSTVGITNSNVDLTNPNNLILVGSDENFSDYTIDWAAITKDFVNGSSGSFIPYPISQNNLANAPAVTAANVSNIPVIEGMVGQLQIIGSTLALPATIKIKGGTVNELVFLNSNETGSAPVAIVVLEDGGTLGLGSATRNQDSVLTTANIGHNGVIVIANGNGQLVLNENIFAQGVSPFLFGPDATSGSVLEITAPSSAAISVSNGSVLDLRGVPAGRTVQFAQNAGLVMNPAAKLLMGGGTLQFTDNATVEFIPSSQASTFFNAIPLGQINNNLPATLSTPADLPHNQFAPLTGYGQGLHNTDSFRTSLIGTGTINFSGDSIMLLPSNAYVGIETLNQVVDAENNIVANIPVTNLTFLINDNALVQMGNANTDLGGVLQIGNVEDLGADHQISFDLTLDGSNAIFQAGSQSVLGLNAGVVKGITNNVSDMLADTLYNVSSITFNLNQGTINSSRIWDTNDPQANIIMIGDNGDGTPQFNLKYSVYGNQLENIEVVRAQNALVQGGSPLSYIVRAPQIGQTNGALAPIVTTQDNQVVVSTASDGTPVNRVRYLAGMVASTFLQDNMELELPKDGATFFNQIKTQEAFLGFTSAHNKANAGSNGENFRLALDSVRVGTVSQGQIIRGDQDDIFSGAGENSSVIIEDVTELGAVFVSFDEATNSIKTVAEIPV